MQRQGQQPQRQQIRQSALQGTHVQNIDETGVHSAPARNDEGVAALEQHVDSIGGAAKSREVVEASLRSRVLTPQQKNCSYKYGRGR